MPGYRAADRRRPTAPGKAARIGLLILVFFHKPPCGDVSRHGMALAISRNPSGLRLGRICGTIFPILQFKTTFKIYERFQPKTFIDIFY